MHSRTWLAGCLLATCLTVGVPWDCPAWELNGYSRTTLRGSWADAKGDDRGAYASEYLSAELDGLPLDSRLFVSGAYRWDLGQEDPDSPFYSSVDRFSGGQHLFLYEAGVDTRPVSWAELTAGRFTWESAESVHLDGAAARVDLARLPAFGLSVSAFGGRLVQFYQDLAKDSVYGLGLRTRLPWDVRADVDYLDYFDDLTRATVRKRFGQILYLKGSLEWVNSDLREGVASATLWLDATGTELTGTFYKKVGNREDDDYLFDFTADADPGRYALERLALDREQPYNQYAASLEQRLGDHATLSLAYTKRDLLDESAHEDASNTSFDVIQVGADLRDPGVPGLSLAGQVSWWFEDRLQGHEASSRSYSLSADQRLGADWTASAAYYWKEEDINNEFENAVARSLDLGLRYRPSRSWDLTLDYVRETDDLLEEIYGVDETHTVESRLTVRF